MSTLDVWSVYWGTKYSPDYVYRLREMVAKHLPLKHRFRCLTATPLEGIETVLPPNDAPGWWQKLSLFCVAEGPSLYFDLDVLIDGDLSGIARYADCDLAMPAEFSGRGKWQSSVMAWNGKLRAPFSQFEPSRLTVAEDKGHM